MSGAEHPDAAPASQRCARAVVAGLLAGGVREVVLAPGSRSAPLAYALYAADRASRLRLHVRLDERGAGFLAVGLAKATGVPAAVVTTSGTATANLHPAVLEAAHSGVPLVALTADRPAAWTHAGANQTTEQASLFGAHARAYAGLQDIGDPAAWSFEVRRILAAATGERSRAPGPAHLNVAFTDPLVPAGLDSPDPVPGGRVQRPATGRPSRPGLVPAVTRLGAGPRTVLVAGDLTPEAGRNVAALADRARVPLLAEPSSNARRGPAALRAYRILLGARLADRIERVVVFGRPTLSRPVTALLARADVEQVVVTDRADWIDPGLRLPAVHDAVDLAPGDPAWLDAWRRADERIGTGLDRLLHDHVALTGPALAATLWAGLAVESAPEGGWPLVVGASNPIRDLDLAPIAVAPPVVYANRGLSGIDGTLATASGVALGTGRPTHALVGDLTFLHDLTGLLSGPDEPRADLRVVVAHDHGGSIFATVEHGRPAFSPAYERLFGTPQRCDLASLCAGVGARHTRVRSAGQLGAALADPPRGLEVVEAMVDRSGRRELDARITALAAML